MVGWWSVAGEGGVNVSFGQGPFRHISLSEKCLIRTNVSFGLMTFGLQSHLDLSPIWKIVFKAPVHLDFIPFQKIVSWSPGIRTSSIQTQDCELNIPIVSDPEAFV